MKELNELLPYLELLVKVHNSGRNVGREIDEAIFCLRCSMGLEEDGDEDGTKHYIVDLRNHLRHHELIGWDENRKQPVIKNSSRDHGTHGHANVPVWDILQCIVRGMTMHQICDEYELSINQVSGAIVFAAYAVSNGKY